MGPFHITRQHAKEIIKDLAFYLAGSLIYAVSVNAFTVPNHIVLGGITGVSTLINFRTGWPIGMLSLFLNIPVFICAIVEIGYKLVGKTMIATVIVSVMIDVIGVVIPKYVGSQMLAAIFGGCLEGVGLSLIFMRGATTGGTDLIARVLGRHFRTMSMGRLMLCVDIVIILVSAVVYGSIESALYGGIAIFVSTKLIDTVLYGTDIGTGKVLFIISEKNAEISREILSDIDRGVTVLKSRGAYSGREGEVLLCAVRRYEVYKVKDLVHAIDKNAFIIVGDAGEITGEGFRPIKQEDKTLKEIIHAVKKK